MPVKLSLGQQDSKFKFPLNNKNNKKTLPLSQTSAGCGSDEGTKTRPSAWVRAAAGPGSDRVTVSPQGPGVTVGDGVAVHSSHSEASAGDCRVAKREVSV